MEATETPDVTKVLNLGLVVTFSVHFRLRRPGTKNCKERYVGVNYKDTLFRRVEGS